MTTSAPASRQERAERAVIRLVRADISRTRAGELLARSLPLLHSTRSEKFLSALETLCAHAEDTEILERVLVRRIELTEHTQKAQAIERYADFVFDSLGDETRAHVLWTSAAQLYAGLPDCVSQAIALNERIIALFPSDAETATRLSTLAQSMQDFARTAAAISALYRATSDATQCTDLIAELAERAEGAQAKTEFIQVIDELVWQLGKEAGREAKRLTAMKARILAESERYLEAATLYQALLENRPELASAGLILELAGLQILAGDVHGALASFAWLKQLGCDAEPLANFELELAQILIAKDRELERASALLCSALSAQPDNERARELALQLIVEVAEPKQLCDALESASLKSGRPYELADYYGSLLERELSPQLAEFVGRRLLDFIEPRVSDPRVLENALTRVVSLSPEARWAFQRVKSWLTHDQEWAKLFALYDRVIDRAATSETCAALLDEAALIARDGARDNERAIAYLERYLTIVPDDSRAETALERLYDREQHHKALIGLLEKRAATMAGEARLNVTVRLARLHLEIAEFGRALSASEELLASGHAEALELLERIVTTELVLEAESMNAVTRAAEKLRQHYRNAGKLSQVARVYEAELATVGKGHSGSDAYIALLDEAATFYSDELGDLTRAGELLSRIVDDARDIEARKAAAHRLANVLLALDKAAERCRVLERLAELEVGFIKQQAFREAAQVALEDLSDPLRAIRNYHRILQRAPSDRAAHNGLILALASTNKFRALAEALLRRAELPDDEAQTRADLIRAAEIYADYLREPLRAIELWTIVRSRYGSDSESFDALSSLYQITHNFSALAELLSEQLRESPSPELSAELARIHHHHTRDLLAAVSAYVAADMPLEAADLFCKSQDCVSDDPSLSLELARALVGRKEFARAEAVLKRQLAAYARRHVQARKLVELELAAVYAEGSHPEAALAELIQTAKLYPDDANVLFALAKLAIRLGDKKRAEHTLKALLVLLHGARHEQTTIRRAEVYAELGHLTLLSGRQSDARDFFDAAFDAALTSEQEAVALDASLRRQGHYDLLERALSRRVAQISDPALRGEAEHELAQVKLVLSLKNVHAPSDDLKARAQVLTNLYELGKQVEQLPGAGAHRERAEQALISALERCDAPALVQAKTLERLLVREPFQGSASWVSRTGDLFSRAGEFDAARRVLETYLERSPGEVSIIRRLGKLALTRGAPFKAVELYARALEHASSDERKQCVQELSDACREAVQFDEQPDHLELYDADTLLSQLASAQEGARESAEIALLRGHVLNEVGRAREGLELLTAFLNKADLRRTKSLGAVYRKIAALHLVFDEIAEALPYLVRAHQTDKSDVGTAVQLGLLAIDLDRTDTASSAFRAAIAAPRTKRAHPERAQAPLLSKAYYFLAHIERSRGMTASARRMLLCAVEQDPSNRDATRLLSELRAS